MSSVLAICRGLPFFSRTSGFPFPQYHFLVDLNKLATGYSSPANHQVDTDSGREVRERLDQNLNGSFNPKSMSDPSPQSAVSVLTFCCVDWTAYMPWQTVAGQSLISSVFLFCQLCLFCFVSVCLLLLVGLFVCLFVFVFVFFGGVVVFFGRRGGRWVVCFCFWLIDLFPRSPYPVFDIEDATCEDLTL